MSDQYVRLLDRIRKEYAAAAGSLAYVKVNWYRTDIYNFPALGAVRSEDMQRTADSLEATYVVRLFSVFEGILKEHLAANHPSLRIAEDASAASLIDRVTRVQQPRITALLRQRVQDVRRYRNTLVHPGNGAPPLIAFPDVLARLTRFADKLPDPLA